MINVEYLIIMCKKAMEKVTKDVIMETCHKKWEENRVRRFVNYFTIGEQAFQCATTSSARANCEYNWSTTIVKEIW